VAGNISDPTPSSIVEHIRTLGSESEFEFEFVVHSVGRYVIPGDDASTPVSSPLPLSKLISPNSERHSDHGVVLIIDGFLSCRQRTSVPRLDLRIWDVSGRKTKHLTQQHHASSTIKGAIPWKAPGFWIRKCRFLFISSWLILAHQGIPPESMEGMIHFKFHQLPLASTR